MISESVTTNKTYVSTFVALIVLLLLTIGATYIDLGDFNLVLALTISVMKTLLIAAFFMHLRQSSRLIWVAATAGLIWLMFLVSLGLGDYLTRP